MTVEARNPFGPRAEFKKRVVATSLTAEQMIALQAMKTALGLDADGAVVKAGLEMLWEDLKTKGLLGKQIPDESG